MKVHYKKDTLTRAVKMWCGLSIAKYTHELNKVTCLTCLNCKIDDLENIVSYFKMRRDEVIDENIDFKLKRTIQRIENASSGS